MELIIALCESLTPPHFASKSAPAAFDANLVIRQEIWDRFYVIARRSPAWIAQGKLERKDAVIHEVVNRLEDLSTRIGDWRVHSRDFR